MDAIAPSTVPRATLSSDGETAEIRLFGAWDMVHARAAEDALASIRLGEEQAVTIDISGVTQVDTSGAWLIHLMRGRFEFAGRRVVFTGISPRMSFLFGEIEEHVPRPYQPPPARWALLVLLERIGRRAGLIWQDALAVLSMLGAFAVGLTGCIVRPWRLRAVSILANFDRTCRGAVPIIALMSFLIGLIISQQGGFYLRQFGADIFVVDLIGVLVLREIGVLLTAIMVAGRSGSAFTAEIGSMKMQEEIDALRVTGLDPIEVLVIPRLIALVLALPVLTFIADIAALFGAGLIVWTYLGITPDNFVARLHEAVSTQELYIGLVKAPAMALIVGLIACIEGLKVKGSAESLGLQTTNSVVKAIFMVIVVDGLFAIFFAAVGI